MDPTLAATPLTPFSATGFFRQPITGTALDPRSARIVAALAAAPAYADLYEFGIPVFTATPGTPLSTVRCTEPWGTCAPSTTPVPIPANAVPSSGSDGAMVVVDPVSRKVYEFWQARRTSATTWTTSWGAVNNLDSNGNEGGGAVGAGISLLGGLVRTHEVAAGVINHPLVFSSSLACAGEFRYPATKTDGASTDPGCIPEGARVRLDPSINVDAIAGITPGEKAVAKALQKYGAFCRDRGGARLAIIFEDPAGKPDPYPAAGLAWDYYAMQRIPWGSLQVMAN